MGSYDLEKKIFLKINEKSDEEYTEYFDIKIGYLKEDAVWICKKERECFNQKMDQYRKLWPELHPMVINCFLKHYVIDILPQNGLFNFEQYIEKVVKVHRESLPDEILNLKLNEIFSKAL